MSALWQHRQPVGRFTLTMAQQIDWTSHPFGGPYVLEYAVRSERRGEITPIGRATWADWDHHGRLIVAQQGRLMQWEQSSGLHEILDFNSFVPDPTPSPDWARTWLRPSGAR
jgi:hypothetical protein